MATTTTQLVERAEIHKSCKAFETLLNVFNDYCEAAGAVVTLQKKLSKALKETASLKTTGEIAANALNASASVFESLSEIDAKYAKLVDKEYDAISSEVKKWFKKLAKEEKAHDERIINVNAKIKQAGQIYEKKVKKNARDADDEHSRYISLISSLGPEISQEKYNHSLMVTQRHTSTTYSVAACLSRIADAEWLRSCEAVKRFAPTIGFLGEYRAYCEGGWSGSPPKEVPDVDVLAQAEAEPSIPLRTPDALAPTTYRNAESGSAREIIESRTPSPGPSPSSYHREEDSARQPTQEQNHSTSTSTAPSSFDPPRPLIDPNTGSVRSLSAFPAPPTHYPPPLRQQSSHSQASRSSSQVSFPTSQRPLDSHNDITADEGGTSSKSSPETNFSDPPRLDSKPLDSVAENEVLQPISSRSQTLESLQTELSSGSGSSAKKGDYFYLDETEHKSRSTTSNLKAIERTDTGGSIVAAMRNRYSYNSGTSSPPPRDLPRLPMSVNDIASRYEEPSSPRPAPRSSSPQISRPRPSLDSYLQKPSTSVEEESTNHGAAAPRHRLADQLELQEKEQQLRAREREIEMKARELERERSNLINARSSIGDGAGGPRSGLLSRSPPLQSPPLRPRERTMSQNDLMPLKRSVSPYSHSPGHLLPPSPRIRTSEQNNNYDRNPSRTSSEHPDYCGCEPCTNAKYNSPSPASMSPASPINLRPVANEKPKGWIRRLSMPIVVGNAFLDSKKNHSTQNLALNGGKGLSSFDSKKNASTTTLRTGATEDGRIASNIAGVGVGRRSYDVANRSSTNLGLGRR